MADRTIVALYDRLDDAHAAMHELVDMGILQDEITVGIRDAEGYRLNKGEKGGAGSRRISSGDFLSALGDLYIPEEDAHLYAEGIRRGAVLLTARVAQDQLEHAMDILERHDPIDIDERESDWRSEGWSRFDHAAAPYTDEDVARERSRYAIAGAGGRPGAMGTGAAAATPTPDIIGTAPSTGYSDTGEIVGIAGTTGTTGPAETPDIAAASTRHEGKHEGEQAIPVVEEELRVGKRQVGGGRVRVRSHIVETPVQEQVQLTEETAHIERRPVDRPAGDIGAAAFQEKTIEVTETREEPVVSKTARVVEEVVVSKDVETHTETVSDTVRRTEVEIEDDRDRAAKKGKGKPAE